MKSIVTSRTVDIPEGGKLTIQTSFSKTIKFQFKSKNKIKIKETTN